MFVSAPGFEYELPHGMLPPGSTCYRAFHLMQGDGWFIASVVFPVSRPHARHRIIFAWDSDVVSVVEGPMPATLAELVYVSPPQGPDTRWRCRTIVRLWRGFDSALGGAETIAFETEEGETFCGLDAVPVPETVGELTLIAETALAAGVRETRQ